MLRTHAGRDACGPVRSIWDLGFGIADFKDVRMTVSKLSHDGRDDRVGTLTFDRGYEKHNRSGGDVSIDDWVCFGAGGSESL